MRFGQGEAKGILGMLYIVDVRMVDAVSGEKIKQKLIVVGVEAADIERKLKWFFDLKRFKEFSITGVEKVREKIHLVSTVITQETPANSPVIVRDEGTRHIPAGKSVIEPYDPHLYAIGIATTMLARDENHALRKTGNAVIHRALNQPMSGECPKLSDDSIVVVEQVALKSGYAMPRDVRNEINLAHIFRK